MTTQPDFRITKTTSGFELVDVQQKRLRDTAVAVGFAPDREYLGYNIEVLAPFIIQDPFVLDQINANASRENAACPAQRSHPDHVMAATLASLTEKEKAAVRRRVWAAFAEWDRS